MDQDELSRRIDEHVTLVPVDVDKEIIEGGRSDHPGARGAQAGRRVQLPREGRGSRKWHPQGMGAFPDKILEY